MSTETSSAPRAAGIWATFQESPLAVKTVLGGVFVNKVGGFLNIFLVLFMTAQGYSAGQAATALGGYGAGAVVGVLIGGALADRLGARNATVLSMASTAVGGLLFIRLGHAVWLVLTIGSVIAVVCGVIAIRNQPTPSNDSASSGDGDRDVDRTTTDDLAPAATAD